MGDATTLLDRFEALVAQAPERAATHHVAGRGQRVVTTSWADWHRRARNLAAGLVWLGLEPGDRVAVLAGTRVEQAWLDVALMMVGAVAVPLFPTETPEGCAARVRQSAARFAVTGGPDGVARLAGLGRAEGGPLERIIYIDAYRDASETRRDGAARHVEDVVVGASRGGLMGLGALYDLGEGHAEGAAAELARRRAAVGVDTLVMLAFTPGSEHDPKGVRLTHGNLESCASMLVEALDVGPDDRHLLYLPLAQIFARVALYASYVAGYATAFATAGHRGIFEDLRRHQPTFVCGVPRLYERVRERWIREHEAASGLERGLSRWARGARFPGRGDGDLPSGRVRRVVAERLLWQRMRERFGGRLRFAISGGAPLAPDVSRFFLEHGLELLEGYGMTETSGATHIQRPGEVEPGTVGRPLEGVDMRLAADGEVLVRGANVTSGYWMGPEPGRRQVTARCLGGWLHTGDIGTVDERQQLRITGRKRDVIVTAHGKAIAPRPIAEALAEHALIRDVVLHGDRRKFLSALVVVDRDALAEMAHAQGLEGDYQTVARAPEVYAAVERLVAQVNQRRPSHEAIRKFAILPEMLSVEAGERTVTQAVRREVVTERYRAVLDAFYRDNY